jgi:hypothetical protein
MTTDRSRWQSLSRRIEALERERQAPAMPKKPARKKPAENSKPTPPALVILVVCELAPADRAEAADQDGDVRDLMEEEEEGQR